ATGTSALAHTDVTSRGYGVSGSGTASYPLSGLVAAAAPANDNWADAIELAGASGSLTDGANVSAATQAPDEPPTPQGGDRTPPPHREKTVWWKWTAPANASGPFVFDTAGSELADTLLGVFTGPTLGQLVEKTGSDDTDAGFKSRAGFDVVGGTTYYIQVGS